MSILRIRSTKRRAFLLAFLLILLAGCNLPSSVPPTITSVAVQPTVTAPTVTAPTTTFTVSPQPSPTAEPTSTETAATGVREIVVICTNDEHGYLLPAETSDFWEGGAGYAEASWLAKGYDPNNPATNTLLLSAGDNWTGPAISTWFQGESVVEVMNAMGYSASAIGNHEFDFGQDVLAKRVQEAKFPYLAANLYRQGTQELPPFARPYTLIEVNGVTVGIIGLAYEKTPSVTSAPNLAGLEFGDYEAALRRWVPVARQEGADVLIVLSHAPAQDLIVLAEQVRDLNISLFLGGHTHQSRTTTSGGALVASGSSGWQDYDVARLEVDTGAGQVIEKEQKLVDVLTSKTGVNQPKIPPSLVAILDKWEKRADLVLGEVIGYTKTGINEQSAQMHNLLVDSWLWAYPDADIAMSNTGGFRQSLPSGEITVGDIVGVFPFEDYILELEMTGKDVLQTIQRVGSMIVVGGLRRQADGSYVLRDGSSLEPDRAYRVLVVDYMYYNNKYPFRLYDDEPYETSMLWRQPVIDWIKAQHSTQEHPLEGRVSDIAWNQ